MLILLCVELPPSTFNLNELQLKSAEYMQYLTTQPSHLVPLKNKHGQEYEKVHYFPLDCFEEEYLLAYMTLK